MPVVNLDTTNLLLGIMAGVSVLEALALIVVSVLAYRAYRETLRTIHRLEEEQIRPLSARVTSLVDRVDDFVGEMRAVTSNVTQKTEQAASFVSRPVSRVVGIVRAAGVVFNSLFNHQQASKTWEAPSESARQTAERSQRYAG